MHHAERRTTACRPRRRSRQRRRDSAGTEPAGNDDPDIVDLEQFRHRLAVVALHVVDSIACRVRPPAGFFGIAAQQLKARDERADTRGRPVGHLPRLGVRRVTAVSPRAADGCIARMMRKPNGARLTSDAALLLS
jgi:hypothetical protein